MRISTSTIYDTATTQMNNLQSALNKTQLQLSSNQKNLTPADDPIASSRALEVTQSQSLNTQLVTNRNNAKNSLSQEDVALTSARDTITSVQTIVVNAGNPTLADVDRASLATQVQSALDQLVGTANTSDGAGGYLFSGYKSTTIPYTPSATGATYQGDQGQRTLQVGSNRTIPVSDPGSAVFDSNLTGNGTFTVSADPGDLASGGINPGNVGRGGSGVIDPGSVSDKSLLTGDTYTINFQVTPADPTTNTAAVTTYTVTDATKGTTVLPAPPAVAAIPYVSGQTINFDGQQTNITGAPADGDSFTVAPSTNQSVFTTLTNLLQVLNTPATGAAGQAALTNGLNAASLSLATAKDNIMTVDAKVGSSQKELDSLDATGASMTVQYATTLSNLQDLDTVSAISLFTQQQTTL
ncbi:MAG TPA: flagellar hook-associated protein FlgL, partial [Janthinobacterium sp.]|nr:flagellar hook-associated protein FlgL [Janthinobacterium sp.]